MIRRLLIALFVCGAALGLALLFLRARPAGSRSLHAPTDARRADEVAPEGSAALSPEQRSEPARDFEGEGAPPPARTSAAARPADASAAELPNEHAALALEVLALDLEDLPVEGAAVFVAPIDGAWTRAGTTGADGLLALRVAARGPRAELAVALGSGEGPEPPMHRVALALEGTTRVALGRRRTADAFAGSQLVFVHELPARPDARRARREPPKPPKPAAPTTPPACGPPPPLACAPAASPSELLVLRDPPRPPALPDQEPASATRPRDAAREQLQAKIEAFLAEQVRGRKDELAIVRGTVETADGRPAANARVAARFGPGLERATRTDPKGSYELADLPPGELALEAGGGDFGRDARALHAKQGTAATWDARLDRGIELRGSFADEAALPMKDVWVEVDRDGLALARWDRALTGDDGAFAIPNLPPGPLRLLAGLPEQPHLPALVLDPVVPGGAEPRLTLHADERPSASVVVEVAFEEELVPRRAFDAPPLELRLWHLDSGRGVWLARAVDGRPDTWRRYHAGSLPAGRYELWVGAFGRRWRAVGPFGLAAERALDLGRVTLAPMGRARLTLDDASLERKDWTQRVVRAREGAEVEILAVRGRLALEHVLAPDDYELHVACDGRAWSFPFRVLAGGETEVRVELDR